MTVEMVRIQAGWEHVVLVEGDQRRTVGWIAREGGESRVTLDGVLGTRRFTSRREALAFAREHAADTAVDHVAEVGRALGLA